MSEDREVVRGAEAGRPESLAAVPSERVVELDVRADLREGREPFDRIMEAREAVADGGALMLRAIFEPVPLYGVMERHGFRHWTDRRGEDDWVIWFWNPGGDVAEPIEPAGDPEVEPASSGVQVLDVRGLEPPEPMVRTLAALERLPPGETLVQINVREPRFLFPRLDELGFRYEVRKQEDDLVRVFIRHAVESPAPADTGARRVLDVRVIPPQEKHPAIFATFGALAAGESFVLVNDHDPRPLRQQLEARHGGAYDWKYLDEGPAVWRVRIRRVAD